MARETKIHNEKFIKYKEYIKKHKNYNGLDFGKNWIATRDSATGLNRIRWCTDKAKELKINENNPFYSKVMLKLHPLKYKPCQVCGRRMWLYYMYPNSIFLKSINKKFNTPFSECDSINKIWNFFKNKDKKNLKEFENFILAEFKIKINNNNKTNLIKKLEIKCRKKGTKLLGPGAMSNFPDRFDGFHTYNRCCRSSSDKGRSKENLKSYSTDRRAYEQWSDGNIYATNKLMGSKFFKSISADHIGPISLGFIHDPRYIQPMTRNENSAKRDRIGFGDMEKIIEIEQKTGILPVSWFCQEIWVFIKNDFLKKLEKSDFVLYRKLLKNNMNIFFNILYTILDDTKECGECFLIKTFLKPNYESFNYNYTFVKKEFFYDIKSQNPRKKTDSSANEFDRYIRIAIESVYKYKNKDNRIAKLKINENEKKELKLICACIKNGVAYSVIKNKLYKLIKNVQEQIIKDTLA